MNENVERVTVSNGRSNTGKDKEKGGDELGKVGLQRAYAKGLIKTSKGNFSHG